MRREDLPRVSSTGALFVLYGRTETGFRALTTGPSGRSLKEGTVVGHMNTLLLWYYGVPAHCCGNFVHFWAWVGTCMSRVLSSCIVVWRKGRGVAPRFFSWYVARFSVVSQSQLFFVVFLRV